MAATKTFLTGIQTSGEPHIGNYVGAIKPALAAAESSDTLYFLADYHSLNTVKDPDRLRHNIRSVAATWLACGLDPDRTVIYRQSSVPEVFELSVILSSVTGKGLMNRAHAYKAARDRNAEAGSADLDAGVNMGLFNYPLLMAADILVMETDYVPVGRDQAQHLEYAADIAGSFNHLYGASYSFPIPQGVYNEGDAAVLPGTDGRKMSKSYDNTIPLFLPENRLRKLVRRIPTDSTPVEEPKNPDSSVVFQLLTHFEEPARLAETRKRLEAGGMGWGELKDQLFEAINTEVAPMRVRYERLMEPDSELDGILAAGAVRARERSRRVLAKVRRAVGID
ncbi:tryptophan--tRNA ligase [Marinitenerispora sediminis]|uniref:Tryptophan--tRNA ligase n=1 Tax=Marinitenerispora sediminis TaxID=1931232 RepID=A0A368T0D4_9ACTN|nr:tryptophan--tRNA ligase [Marinitenerispora sediminis]RCV49943.1 tryptophan--tRNA ligase [Marinitenerispora sediminis]RCV51054.1 tryptophan--tRNA ligase [Marinitenerispora sediminis]RCV52345.1 tryptophan--tRNA ligase [Marinitenerispora sediminis]